MISNKELGSWLRDNESLLYKMVWTHLRRLGANPSPDDVELITADAMWRAWEYRSNYTKGASIKAWISAVAKSSCLDVLREHSREQKRREHYLKHLSVIRTVPSPEHDYIQHETIQRGFATLNPRQQHVTWLSFLGYDYHEIATELGITWMQVKSDLSHGRRKASHELL